MTTRETPPPEPDDEPDEEDDDTRIARIFDSRLEAFFDRHKPRSEEETQLGKLREMIRSEVSAAVGGAGKGGDNGQAGTRTSRNDRRPARAGSGGNERTGGILGFLYGQPDD